MVRTKATAGASKATGGKAPRKNVSAPVRRTYSDGGKAKDYSGGNPYHPQETPEWQKPITAFLITKQSKDPSADFTSGPSCSGKELNLDDSTAGGSATN